VPRAEVISIPNGVFVENCFIVADPDTREAVLIDPGEEAGVFLQRLDAEGLTLRAVWLTHAHLDHVLGVGAVVAATGVPVYLHADDRALYDGVREQGEWFGLQIDPLPEPDHELHPGETVSIGSVTFEIRHVSGHSPGSVAFVGEGLAIVGDALFQGSIGRTDLPGGNLDTLLTSIREQLLTLPDDTVVYSGHGPVTTIGAERRSNPFLTGAVRLV
jgi:glyoxylase-like metal-dependent hydrolase (beta-lactamase superfamily II)